jgi:amidase
VRGDDELLAAGAARQARLVRTGAVSARELIVATLARIQDLDDHLGAYRVVFDEAALAEADRIDARRIREPVEHPLLGVPVAVKDDLDVAGSVTAWGTDAFGPPATADSEAVARLRRAGAIVIGKTNVPEMTLWPWTASPTWGVTRNPWHTGRTPGGSSGGSAVAVATGMCGVALGSDGGGSIRYPAALTGVFGLKPQRDRIPLDVAHADAWNGLLVLGPIARRVRDAALLLDVTADGVPDGGFVSAVDGPQRRLRIAVSHRPPPGSLAVLDDDRRAAVDETAALLQSLGHQVVAREIDHGAGLMTNATIRYVAGVAHDVATMPRSDRLDRSTRQLAAAGARIPARWLDRARRDEATLASRIASTFEQADVLLTPMAGAPPLLDDVVGRGLVGSLRRTNVAAWAVPWNVTGQPAASVPVGFDRSGLPCAVQLAGRAGDELTLVQLAAELERERPWTEDPLPLGRPAPGPVPGRIG